MADRTEHRLRVGVVGLGIAGGLMVPCLLRHPRATLAGVADRDAELRARFARDYALPVEDEAEALIARADVDAVYIATPHQFHRSHTLLAAEHGKHVVVEKPMALTLADCDAMTEAAARAEVALVVGHTHSFDPAIAEIARRSEAGEWGSLAMLALWNYTDFLYRPRRPEELDTAQGGGILFNQLPHHVDIARLLARSPVRSVRASTAVLDPTRPTEGCCMAFIDFVNGAAASAVYSGYDHFDSDELHGWVSSTGRRKTPRHGESRRALSSLTGGDAEARLRATHYGYGGGSNQQRGVAQHQPHFGTLIATFERADVRTTPDGVAVYDDDGVHEISLPSSSDGRTRVVDELCAAVLDGTPPSHDGAFARTTVETCLAIQESARLRREVVLH
ncbi:Gfo/Idh/MocA family protein [Piscinibacter koreensis]|uniref:Gfo/Idh/MocA family oxidoreductase n=1 Tax=Piscinibacter koreensis TaxID=2742824 RepID=A0A7Y6NQZ3_9BURK|nr:Gfo/Idh/MocA family oxidoreductase [Schlegelella koreensis]NUZ07691.1 Gfo/Idh/MocA family oxidoreductase [Schlegelella koreensis]